MGSRRRDRGQAAAVDPRAVDPRAVDPRAGVRTAPEVLALQAGLSAPESRVFLLYCEGLTVDAIAARLRLRAHSVECYASRARRKIIQRFAAEAMVDECLEEWEECRRGAAG